MSDDDVRYSDEYHTQNPDDILLCAYCGERWADHEKTCPYNPNKIDDEILYQQLKEKWTETP